MTVCFMSSTFLWHNLDTVKSLLSEMSLLLCWNVSSHIIIKQSQSVRCHSMPLLPNPVGIKTHTHPAVFIKSTC